MVELDKYKEALGALNEAKMRDAAYSTIAITSKIEALSGLGGTNRRSR